MRVFLTVVGAVAILWACNAAVGWVSWGSVAQGVIVRDAITLTADVPVYVTTNQLAGVACRLPVGADVAVIAKRDGFVRVKGAACAGWVRGALVEWR